jgi:hypothetical protein
MRIAVFVLAIVGGLGSAALGLIWLINTQKERELFEAMRNNPENRDFFRALLAAQPPGENRPAFLASPEAALAENDRRVRAYPFLLAGLLLSVAGGVLAMLRKGKSGAVLLALAVLGPAVLHPWSLIFTGLLIVAAGLSVFVGPRRVPYDYEPRPRRRLRLAEE